MALNVALGSYSGHGEHSEAIKEMAGGGINRYFSDSLRISYRCLSPHLALTVQLHTHTHTLVPVFVHKSQNSQHKECDTESRQGGAAPNEAL